MATESKNVELRIRARDLSTKTLEDVVKNLERLGDAQKEQAEASKKGQTSARELEASYKAIEQTVQALINQNNLTKAFEDQAGALERAKQKANEARTAYTEYDNALAGVEEKTKKQIAAQEKLARAVANADKAQTNAQNRLDGTVARLQAYGIATDNIAGTQARLVDAFNRGTAALVEQDRIIEANEQSLRAAAAAAKKTADDKVAAADKEKQALKEVAAAAEQAARVQKLQDLGAQQRAKVQQNLVAERALAQALRESAQQAEASAKSYATLARSVTSVRGDELGKQLRAIVDPTAVANSNINTLGQNIDALAVQVNAINGPVKAFRTTMAQLEATQKASAGIAAQIDGYRRQLDVLRQARTAYADARRDVLALSVQMRAGGGDAAELGRKLRESESALSSSANAMSRIVTATRGMRDALREAGVDTQNLAASEAKLVAQTKTATTAVEKLSDAFNKHGAAGDKAAKGNFKFFESTRTTLSYTQRLRGEVLALATAYVGVQGAINTAAGALDAYKNAQKIEGQLGAAFGTDAKVIREEWTYLMNTANRIGISFAEAAPAYAKFAISAKSFGLNGQETRFIFENMAQAARVAGLTADEFAGTLKAVEQAFSKGTVQAEELRGQLGDRLPGAFTAFARASNQTTAELSKDMENSAVKADAFINFAREMPKVFVLTDTALQGLQASQERYNNALFEFQIAVAQSGFADAYTKLLKDLAELMKSADGQAFAQSLSDAFSAVVSVLRFTIENVDELKTILSVLVGLVVGKWALAAAGAFTAFGASVITLVRYVQGAIVVLGAGGGLAGVLAASGVAATTAAGGVGILRGALLLLSRTVPLIAAVSTAILAAVWAYDKLTAAKRRSEDANNDKANARRQIRQIDNALEAPGMSNTVDPGTGGTVEKRAIAAAEKELEKNAAKVAKDLKAARKRDAKEELADRQQLIKDEYQAKRAGIDATIKDEKEASRLKKAISEQEATALLADRTRFYAENAKAGQAAAAKEVGLKERIKNELLKIEDDLAKDSAKLDQGSSFEQRRATRVEAISNAYNKLKKNIADLSVIDKVGAADALKKLDGYIAQRQELEAVKVTTEEIKRLEKDLTDQASIRDNQLKQQQDLYNAGQVTQEQFLANTAEINTRGDSAIKKAAADLQAFVDAAVAAQAGILSLTKQADIRAKTTGATAGASNTTNKIADASLAAQEQAIDALIAKRSAAENIFRTQFELRMISEDEYSQKSNANADLYKAKILELTQAMLAQLEARKAQGLLDQTLNPQQLAALDAQIAKYQQVAVVTQNAELQQGLFNRTLAGAAISGIDSALNGVIDSLTAIANGTATAGEGFKGLARTVAGTVASILQQLALAIAKQLIFNALANSGNPYLMAIGAVAGGTKRHRGGVIGRSNTGQNVPIDPSWFVGAPRFHEGGLPGLRSDEVPSILQTGEEVLARNDPRNVLNGAAKGNPAGTRFVLVDDRSKIPEAMQSAEGEDVIVQTIRRNSATVKQMLR